ncbi:hypothetical protein P152DRAFT_60916 [Eremomyces bilateralis CBS 781.70]|uniref:Uncharacterized protein n=1 Tax=Eremomyces bilateralis CBS 781.70 TaxID=1392243 RepID=A0A6G1G1C8_9PEZI|nr:uncharacterized protein P152DRAFT_60916 [Eremomyces bilateralis CBS 781.70]KAF1811609.1 hypothetical protein P152DRAFT_60916 [Eremomyces bilateralis CBS 781.70]
MASGCSDCSTCQHRSACRGGSRSRGGWTDAPPCRLDSGDSSFPNHDSFIIYEVQGLSNSCFTLIAHNQGKHTVASPWYWMSTSSDLLDGLVSRSHVSSSFSELTGNPASTCSSIFAQQSTVSGVAQPDAMIRVLQWQLYSSSHPSPIVESTIASSTTRHRSFLLID